MQIDLYENLLYKEKNIKIEHKCKECGSAENTHTEQKTKEVLCEKCLIKRIMEDGE